MPTFLFSSSRRFRETDRESDRRFQTFLTSEQTKATDHLAAVQDEISKQLTDINKKFADAVKQAQKSAVTMQDSLDAAIDAESDKFAELQTQLTKLTLWLVTEINKTLADFPAVIYGFLGGLQSRSAGTPIVINRDSTGSDTPKRSQNMLISGAAGVPGSFMFSYGVPPEGGWLLCDGSVKRISDYQNLFNAMGDYFGLSLSPDGSFKLPSAADLPTIPGNANWYVRT